ncbi:MAG: LPS export ABC transporter permease LptF [Acidobacteria bacterium RIFCSPLOWO2_02_FULL_68_18]|nr:MAG: LPS export ABC transporter permease LptF [Acidobacteria bacterium RIFCSPLOWO2_02_FULL_68_18]OFW47974.1 MAG: LPS export ABC transporter permease LptF [Acidobacteria bacterium RIFCSPLOWO2_12_FULL_68_19]
MRTIDRYIVREVLWPFVIGLLVFTFMLIIPYLIEYAESFISKGVPVPVVLRVMGTLLPSALALTVPMSLLLGLLVAFGRLSADREFVALQACGVSLFRLMRPVGVLSVLAWIATSYTLLVAVPDANQRFREITFGIVAERAEGEVRPRVFFEDFPDVVLYVRELAGPGGGWRDVFMADNRAGQTPAVYLARHGRVLVDRARRSVEMVLDDAVRHTADEAGKYEVVHFDRLLLSLNPETVFPRQGPPLGAREMSIPQLQARAAELEAQGIYPHSELFEIQKKFSIPFACLIFGLIGLALGVNNRRDGKLASFVIGLGVIFIYYVVLWLGQALVRGHMAPPWLAAWAPNILLGGLGLFLFRWRDRGFDRPLRVPVLPTFGATGIPPLRLPMLGILDRYVATTYVRIAALSVLAMAGIFYIAAFLDLSDKVFRGQATWGMLGAYFWFATPQYVYYILPLSVLLAALVTVGLLTKNSELVVMKACGISLYRVAVPMLGGALVAGGALFLLEESVLGPSNRRAEALRHVIRGGSPQTFDVLHRQWVTGSSGEIYHFDYYDPRTRRLSGLSAFEFGERMQLLARRTYAERAEYAGGGPEDAIDRWTVHQGWTRELNPQGETRTFTPFATSEIHLEPATHFGTEPPDERFMSYSQLRTYTARLQATGFDVSAQLVALERKISFPFVTIVMTLLAVPFAVTTGRRGAMYGIGVGIVLAITYWVAISIFAALGTGGLVAPALAAWAPNLLFGAGAGYLLLTVRT